MFPHTITVFTLKKDRYVKRIVEGVYWEGSNEITQNGKGINNVSNINVYIPIHFGLENIEKGSYIMKGEYSKNITSMEEIMNITDCITVDSIMIRDVGSELDHYQISGV